MGTRKGMNEIRLSYQELRERAIQEGIKDNKVSIGIWLKYEGFQKHHTIKDNKSVYYYTNNK